MSGAIGGRVRWIGGALLAIAAISPLSRGEDEAERPDAPPRFPSLPGAVEEAPAWLLGHAPFDVARFFDAPPPRLNAARGYLVALAEFGDEVRTCFPPGPECDARTERARARRTAFDDVSEANREGRGPVASEQIDRVLDLYEEGFHRLVLAQSRERCVFLGGLGITATLPHAQASRMVARVAELRIRRDVETGDLDDALRTLEITLRLARDLKPRGHLITQLVAISMEIWACRQMIPPILSAPGLTAAHCDRLLRSLAEHEARSVDPYAEALRANYIMGRVVLHDFIFDQGKLAWEFGVEPGGSVFAKWIEMTERQAAPAGPVAPFDPDDEMPPPPEAPELRDKLIDLRLALTSPRTLAVKVAQLDGYYAKLFELGSVPIAERLQELPDPAVLLGGEGPMNRILQNTVPPTLAFTQAFGRQVACLHATQCLIALRRWRFDHEAPPASLLDAVKAGGMVAIPADPYDAKPLRMALIEGEPVIYSVGKDGVDEGGLVDSVYDTKAGDQIYRLPAAKVDR